MRIMRLIINEALDDKQEHGGSKRYAVMVSDAAASEAEQHAESNRRREGRDEKAQNYRTEK